VPITTLVLAVVLETMCCFGMEHCKLFRSNKIIAALRPVWGGSAWSRINNAEKYFQNSHATLTLYHQPVSEKNCEAGVYACRSSCGVSRFYAVDGNHFGANQPGD
jgi:hypothetical protein